jgi:hypothetical protein
LEKLALEYLDEEEEDLEMVVANVSEEEDQDIDMEEKTDSDLEMLHDAPDVFKTPKKKRVVKVKEQIDDDFLWRSKRISQKLGGFKNTESAKMYIEAGNKKVKPSGSKSKKTKSSKKAKKMEGEPSTYEVLEPTPLAVIPPKGKEVAPYLTKNVLEGIGEGFLQIQPMAVSAALLEQDDLDE